jgi:chromosomal replication initiation ATPase DnaA
MVEVVASMVEAIRARDQSYGNLLLSEFDVLLIDDLDRDASKPQTWIELMHLLDEAHSQGVGIVATGHQPLVAQWPEEHVLSSPDGRTRAYFAAREAEAAGLPDSLPLLREAANAPAASVGQLQGRLRQLTAHAKLLTGYEDSGRRDI